MNKRIDNEKKKNPSPLRENLRAVKELAMDLGSEKRIVIFPARGRTWQVKRVISNKSIAFVGFSSNRSRVNGNQEVNVEHECRERNQKESKKRENNIVALEFCIFFVSHDVKFTHFIT